MFLIGGGSDKEHASGHGFQLRYDEPAAAAIWPDHRKAAADEFREILTKIKEPNIGAKRAPIA